MLIEIGDDMAQMAQMARVGSLERLACAAPPSPGSDESAGKRKSGCMRDGNNVIRYILCGCRQVARARHTDGPRRCR